MLLQKSSPPHDGRAGFKSVVDIAAGLGPGPAMACDFKSSFQDGVALNHPGLDPPNLSWEHDLHANFLERREGQGQISPILDRSGLPSSRGDNGAYLEGPGGLITALGFIP